MREGRPPPRLRARHAAPPGSRLQQQVSKPVREARACPAPTPPRPDNGGVYFKVQRKRVREVRAGREAAAQHASRAFRARGPGTAGRLRATERAGERGDLAEREGGGGAPATAERPLGRLLCKTMTRNPTCSSEKYNPLGADQRMTDVRGVAPAGAAEVTPARHRAPPIPHRKPGPERQVPALPPR